jgi:hypothetical protein
MKHIMFIVLTLLILCLPTSAKQLFYEAVTAKQLVQNPDKYHGKPVAIDALIKGVIEEHGMMGGKFKIFVLGEYGYYVDVFITEDVTKISHSSLVVGVYNKTGRFRGRTYGHFIVAKAIS